ncbi:MAG: tripartite tricarboxylate transporter substrate binding protein [Alphaproteobacteria bacterium]|nr:tripartite tricarboxylate transporter substrate binding protein [Alphaproteobacteria bacterium]
MRRALAWGVVAAAAVMSGSAFAQDWPTRPLTMIVPFAAGGGVDTTARSITPRLAETLGQQIVVENVGGSGGMIGGARVAKAAPDGYTFMMGSAGTHAINQSLYKKPLYNSATDFTAAGIAAHSFFILIARKDFPANTLPEFVAYAKANGAKMQYASAGAGSSTHVACLILNAAIGASITHIPYRGTAMAIQDLMAGRIDYICEPISTALAQVRGGNVKAVVNLGPARTPVLPDLATAAEQGLPDATMTSWTGFFFPKGTPAPIVKRFSQALHDALETPAVRTRLQGLGLAPAAPQERTPEFAAKFIPAEIEKWGKPIRAAGLSAD